MDIILRRNVKTKSFRLLMDIRRSEKRDDIVSILMLASENGGLITPTDICTHLIANMPTIVGERIIQRCIDLQLLEKSANVAVLTDDGRRAVERKMVPLPERGLYQIIYSDDPLLPSPLLDCFNDEKKDSDDEDESEEIDPFMRKNIENKYFQLLEKGRREIFIEKIEPFGRNINKKSHVLLTYSLLGNGKVFLQLGGDFESEIKPPEFNQIEIWNLFVESMYLSEDWDINSHCLRRGFEELKSKNLVSFTMDIERTILTIEKIGEFNEVHVKNIPIIPRTQEDAQKWAIWLLLNEIKDYVKPNEYNGILQKILAKFPGYNLKLPTQLELARKIGEEAGDKLPSTYWYLKAPIDIAEVM